MDLGLHGANPALLYRSLGIARPDRIIDFSTNTNPLPFNGLGHIDFLALAGQYPGEEAAALLHTIERVSKYPGENLLLANGSNELIYLLAALYHGKRGAVLEPAYGEYRRSFRAYGLRCCGVDKLEDLARDADIAYICNPNNPTGGYWENDRLLAVIGKHPHTLFVVDEAYRDFLPREMPALPLLGNLFLLRSLTKIFHLSGLRIGYGVGPQALLGKLRQLQPSWSVNAPALAVAKAFLDDERYVENTKVFFREERERVLGGLRAMGYAPLPTLVNFFLLPTGDDLALIDFMLRRGLVLRHTRNFSGLDGAYVRVAIKSREENDILLAAFAAYREKEAER